MKEEIRNAAKFLKNLLRARGVKVDTLEKFYLRLQLNLSTHYENHWFENQPSRGSGYRCIRINPKMMDPILEATWVDCEPENSLDHFLPKELTLWVDPKDVSYRIGENGSIGVLYSGDQQQQASGLQQHQQHQQLHHQHHQVQPHHQQPLRHQLQQQPQLPYSFHTGSCKKEINRITMESRVPQMPVFS